MAEEAAKLVNKAQHEAARFEWTTVAHDQAEPFSKLLNEKAREGWEVAFFSAAGPQVRVQPDPVTGSPYSRPYFSALLRRDARVPVTPGPTDLSIFEALNKDRDPQSL